VPRIQQLEAPILRPAPATPRDEADFALLKRTLTVERIRREFPALIRGEITRYVIEHRHGLNFVIQDALEGGVNSSLNLDSHGKSWSYLILGLEIDESA
jgi:hypothetical protein